MLGFLLARAGVEVVVLEKHKDFFRDFRGDTVHPSTLELMYELGILNEFLKVPHQELTSVGGVFGDYPFQAASMRRVPTHCKFVALMPQWDFLDFLSGQAKKFSTFHLRMQHEAVDLIQENGRICGVRVRTPEGDTQIHASLVVGCDGRHAITRQAAQLEVLEFGVPIDVLWFRLSREPGDPDEVFGNVNYGRMLILINRGDYFQAGLIIPKGSFDNIRQGGMDAFREGVRRIAPFLGDWVDEVRDWDEVKLLSVQINRLKRWYRPGLLCIGDAAHAMSPAGGVGINLAIQDAVAAANLLAQALLENRVTEASLAQVQKRREFPTRVTQRLQVMAHNGLQQVFRKPGPLQAPWQFKTVTSIPGLQHVLGRLVGVGVRPEHIEDSEVRLKAKKQRLVRIATAVAVATGVAVSLLKIFASRSTAQARQSAGV